MSDISHQLDTSSFPPQPEKKSSKPTLGMASILAIGVGVAASAFFVSISHPILSLISALCPVPQIDAFPGTRLEEGNEKDIQGMEFPS